MRAQDEKIKGFNILELIVVLVIIGVVSAIGYPKFSDWRLDRETRNSVIKIKSLIQGINAQVQRGQYAFVQVHVLEENDSLVVTSKGMKPQKLASLLNDGESEWWTDGGEPDYANICKTTDDDTYWDDNPFQGADNIEVRQITLDNVATTWQGDDGAICFSKNDRWYSGAPQLQSGTGDEIIVDSNLFVCRRTNLRATCDINDTGIPTTEHKNLYTIEWSRFGNVSYEKFKNNYIIDSEDNKKWNKDDPGEWIKQQ
tara:strand:- start:2519 stop:3286 length:768 start_codon:yes stop_codon:yes gene_type:complete